MPPESMQVGESSKQAIERPGHKTNLGEAAMHASSLILSLVKEAAALSPSSELKQAAAVALIIFETIQAVKENKEAYKRLGDDSAGLIVAIWRSYKKAESPKEWLSADMQEILVELTHILDRICSFVRGKLSRNKAIRVIYSRADVAKIAEYRENLNAAMQKFELQSHMNIDLKLGKLLRHRNGEDIKRTLEITAREAKDLEETERIHEQELKAVKKVTLEHLERIEIDHRAEDEREHSEESKNREKAKDRQSELERLRAAARAMEMKKAEEEEMADLRRKIAASRRSVVPQTQPSKKSSTQEDEFENELGARTNPRSGGLETSTDDDTDEELKKREKGKDRQSELERLRAAAHAMEMANRLAEEEEMADLRKKIAAGRRSTMPQPQPSTNMCSTQKDEFEDELERKTNPRRSPTGLHGRLETLTDDDIDEEELKRKKGKDRQTELERLRAAAHAMETANRLAEEEEMADLRRKIAAGRRSTMPQPQPSTNRSSTQDEFEDELRRRTNPHRSPTGSTREMEDLMAQFQGLGTPLGSSPHGSRSSSPMYFSPYHGPGSPLPPSTAPGYGYGYGPYGGGVPGVGSITNSIISNVGNDNSVKKVYRAPRNRRN